MLAWRNPISPDCIAWNKWHLNSSDILIHAFTSIKSMTTIAIVQARTFPRLPGKVLMPIQGVPLILQLERLRQCNHIDRLILATSKDPSDILAYQVANAGFTTFVESYDVLARFHSWAPWSGESRCPSHRRLSFGHPALMK